MAHATTAFHNRIAIAFDFDDTLGPPTFPRIVAHCGYDPEAFERERVEPLVDGGWEKPLARTYALVRALRDDGRRLTEDDLAAIGREHPLFEGVKEMFGRVRRAARAIVPDVDVRFYLITAGFAEVPTHCAIAGEFESILGGSYYFDPESKQLAAARRIITHHEKTRYLLQIAKGLPPEEPNPNNAVQPRDPAEWLVPLDQMVFIGDGSSDLPAFHFMRECGGLSIGVFAGDSAADWDQLGDLRRARPVDNLAGAGFSEGSELLRALLLATESIAKRVALRKLGRAE